MRGAQLGLLAMTLVGCSSALSGAQEPSRPQPFDRPQVITSAFGEAKVVPDRARIQIAVQTRAVTAAAAGSANARKQRAVLDTLRAVGFTAEQLSTVGYSVQPEFRYDKEGGTPQVTGYVVTNTIRADAPRIEMVGPAIDASLAKGANNIEGLEFYSSRADEARRASLADAVARARGDAEAMARSAGGSLGGLLEISTSVQATPIQGYAAGVMRAEAAVPTPIQPGEQTVRTTVTARWQFVPTGR